MVHESDAIIMLLLMRNNTKRGIQDLKVLDPRKIRKVRETKKKEVIQEQYHMVLNKERPENMVCI